MPIRVLLADDHRLVRDGLSSMLSREMDIEVVGEAENGRTAVALARDLMPDVVVMDITMRGLNGIEATRQITSELKGVRVVALSMHADRGHVAEMLAAGATGYLLKDGDFEQLTEAIRAAAEGRTFLAPNVAGIVIEDYVRRLGSPGESASPQTRALSAREREVLQLIAEGHSTKEIAATLHLSVKTVETHRRQIMDKLGIYNIAGLIKYAVREGMATLDD